MGTENDLNIYIPDAGEAGASWGPKVSANFSTITDLIKSVRTAVLDETTARSTAISDAVTALTAALSVRGERFARLAATGNVNIAAGGLLTVDSMTTVDGDRVFLPAQTDATQNGLYVAHSGAWVRTTDADTSAELQPGMLVSVAEGQANADSIWELQTNAPIVLGTTSLVFQEITGSAKDALVAHLAGSETFTGQKNFTGGLLNSGSPVPQRLIDQGAAKTAPYSAGVWQSATFDLTGGAFTQPLPSSPAVGDVYEAYVSATASGNTLTLTGAGGPFMLTSAGHGVTFRWTGSAWVERQDRKTKASLDAAYLPGSATKTFYPEQFLAKGDVVNITDASITTGQAALTSAGQYTFTSLDVGKLVAVEGAATAGTTNPLGVLMTTISAVASNVATLSATATATVSGGNCSFGSDDTVPLTNFFAALSAAPRGSVYRGVMSAQYATSAAVSDGGGNYQLYGTAMNALWKMDTSPIPIGPSVQQFPYIAGACIVAFATGLATGIVASTGNGQILNWENVGLRYAKPFSVTGHGHYAVGPLVPSQTYHKSGLIQSRFVNTAVFGHDGNSYAFRHVNSYRNEYQRNLSSGGGGISNYADNNSFTWGNHTYLDPEVHCFIGGSAHAFDWQGANNASSTSPLLMRPNAFISNLTANYYPSSSPATSSQKFIALTLSPLSLVGGTVIAPDFESPSVAGVTFDWPTGTTTVQGGAGFSFDTGHYMNGPTPPQYRVLSDTNLHEFYNSNTRNITASTDTMAAGWKSARHSIYDTTSNAIVVTLPTGTSTIPNGELWFKKKSADANTVTLNASGGNKFYNSSGPTSLTLTNQGDGYKIIWDGSFLIPYKA